MPQRVRFCLLGLLRASVEWGESDERGETSFRERSMKTIRLSDLIRGIVMLDRKCTYSMPKNPIWKTQQLHYHRIPKGE